MLKGQETSSQSERQWALVLCLVTLPTLHECVLLPGESDQPLGLSETEQPPSVALGNPPNVLHVRVWKGQQDTPGTPMPKPTPALTLASPLLVVLSLCLSPCVSVWSSKPGTSRASESLPVSSLPPPVASGFGMPVQDSYLASMGS